MVQSTEMDDLDFVRSCLLADGKDKWPQIAEKTGVPVDTLIKVARGHTRNPRFHTVDPLTKYYRAQEGA